MLADRAPEGIEKRANLAMQLIEGAYAQENIEPKNRVLHGEPLTAKCTAIIGRIGRDPIDARNDPSRLKPSQSK